MHLVYHPEFSITFVFISPGHYSGPREIEDNAYAQLFLAGGAGKKRCIMGGV